MKHQPDYADDSGDGINGNRGTAQQVKIVDGTPKWVLIMSLVMTIVALIMAFVGWWIASQALRDAREAIQGAQTARIDAQRSADRADIAERRANISEVYAKQVYTELNRLGYPVLTPLEMHPPQPSDNVAKEPQ